MGSPGWSSSQDRNSNFSQAGYRPQIINMTTEQAQKIISTGASYFWGLLLADYEEHGAVLGAHDK